MILSEIELAWFLPVVLVLHWLLPRRAAWQNAFVLVASYVFYASWNVRLLPLILIATAVDYAVGRWLGQHAAPDEGEPAPALLRRRRLALAASLAWNLGALVFFKYYGWFAESLNALLVRFGMPDSLPVLGLALPLGISYYTLQKLGYVIDVYHGRQAPTRSLLTFATFTAFFPQLIAGPISRASELLPQLEAPRRLDPDRLRAGAGAFLLGFVLKAYAAEILGRYVVNPVFAAPAEFSVLGHWMALFGYAGQVFSDFAGYSLMAIGVGRFLGVELPQNFNFPFLSKSLFEFWRRWHITLNRWLFDYIYGAIATSRGWWRGRLDLGLMLVFLASGIWHGAAATFVVWGALHGVGLIVNRRWDEWYRRQCRKDRKYVALRKSAGYAAAGWVLTQAFFLFSLIPFRAPSLSDASRFAAGLFTSAGTELPGFYDFNRSFNLACVAVLLVAYHFAGLTPGQKATGFFFRLPAPVRGCVYGLVVVFLALLMPTGGGAFIYAQF